MNKKLIALLMLAFLAEGTVMADVVYSNNSGECCPTSRPSCCNSGQRRGWFGGLRNCCSRTYRRGYRNSRCCVRPNRAKRKCGPTVRCCRPRRSCPTRRVACPEQTRAVRTEEATPVEEVVEAPLDAAAEVEDEILG